MNIRKDSRGWWWHIKIYNYLTSEVHAFNSKHPFSTYVEALRDLLCFLEYEYEKQNDETRDC